MPLVFGKSLYLHTLFFTVISLKTYRIDMSKILIIDDEVQIRTLLTRMMELEGYDVCQAGDCRAALKQLELQNPDVVLCPDRKGGAENRNLRGSPGHSCRGGQPKVHAHADRYQLRNRDV